MRIEATKWLQVLALDEPEKPVEILIIGALGESLYDESSLGAKQFTAILESIPEEREITVGINSPGGPVQDGLGIYNALQRRKSKVTIRVDGECCSSASLIACAGSKTITPESSTWMIHDPWTIAIGDQYDMAKVAEMLRSYSDAFVAAYVAKTGMSESEIREMMKEETWMSGAMAHEMGFADELIPAGGSDDNEDEDDDESFAAAKARWGAVFASGRRSDVTTNNKPSIGGKMIKKESANPAAAIQPQLIDAPETETTAPEILALNAKVKALEAERDRERTTRHERTIDAAIADGRITVAERDEWRALFGVDETRASKILAAREPRSPGVEPVVQVVTDDPRDVGRGIETLLAAQNSWRERRGADFTDVINSAREIARVCAAAGDRLKVYATNTISADLKRTVILNEVLRAFKRNILPLNQFSTIFLDVPLEGADTVTVPYYPLQSTTSTDFNASNGYDTESNTNDDSKKVTINKRKYQMLKWTSATLRRQPYFSVEWNTMLAAEQLGVDVFLDVLSVVTASNYSTAALSLPAGAFDSIKVAELAGTCSAAHWPSIGRSLFVNSDYATALRKDDAVRFYDRSNAMTLQTGTLPPLSGFTVFEVPLMPSNSENLVGMAAFRSAILVATAPIEPARGVRQRLVDYQLVMDADTGIGFSYRYGGDDIKDTDYAVIEAAYGYVKGEAEAIKRIVSSGT